MDLAVIKVLKIFTKNKLLKTKTPVHVSFQTTTACNLECSYCYANARRPRENELTTEEAKGLFVDLKKLGIFTLVFSGGEPLLRDDLYDLVKFASSIKLITCLATNGVLLTKEKANKLKDLGLDIMHFTVDGSSEEINSQYRGKGTFKKTLRGLENAVNTGLPVLIQTVVDKHNREDLENIAALLINKGIKIWRLHVMIPCGRGKAFSQAEGFSSDELKELMEHVYLLTRRYKNKLKINFHDLHFYKIFLYRKAKFNFLKKFMLRLVGGCPVIEGAVLYINSDGSVRPCSDFPYVLPDVNVRTQSIIDICRNNLQLKQLQDKNNLKGICRTCKYQFLCGGCRAKAFVQNGDLFAEDASCPFI